MATNKDRLSGCFRQLRSTPEDVVTRMALADLLEELGDPWGEWVRTHPFHVEEATYLERPALKWSLTGEDGQPMACAYLTTDKGDYIMGSVL